MSAWVREHQTAPVIRDLKQETSGQGNLQEPVGGGAQSTLSLPLVSIHRNVGGFLIRGKHPYEFSEHGSRSLSTASDIAAHGGDKCSNLASVRHTSDKQTLGPGRLSLLLELTDQMASNRDLRTLLRTASTTLRQIMQCNTIAVHLPDWESGLLRLFALDSFDGRRKEESVGAHLEHKNCGEDVCEAFLRRKPLFSAESSICAVPLISRNCVLGVLELVLFENQSFGRADLDFVTHLAGYIAIAVENALVHGEIEELRDKLAKEKLRVEDKIRKRTRV